MANTTTNKHPADLVDQVQQQWSADLAGRCVLEVALSGGLDSVVLLHLMWRLQHILPIRVTAVHVHHGLQAAADEWWAFCHQLCAQWGIPLRAEQVTVCQDGLGMEAAARAARYAVFEASQADVVVLGHHMDDQVETFMLSALRGGGVRALAAMPAVRPLGKHTLLWRPLLPFRRLQLQQYAQAMGLASIQDPSNQNTQLLRNWLRVRGLPAWRERVPHLDEHICSSVAQLQDDLALIDELRQQDWHEVCAHGAFDVTRWQRFSRVRQQALLHDFAQHHHLGVPSRAGVLAFAAQLRQTPVKAHWPLPCGQAVLCRGILWPQQQNALQQWPWLAALPGRIHIGQPHQDIPIVWTTHTLGLPGDNAQLSVRPVCSNDTLGLKIGRKKVKKMLQERHIPAFMRNIWPVLLDERQRCVAVVNVGVDIELGVAGGLMPMMAELPNIMQPPTKAMGT